MKSIMKPTRKNKSSGVKGNNSTSKTKDYWNRKVLRKPLIIIQNS